MRKGLITKIESNFCLVMTDDMVIERIKKLDTYRIGQRVAFGKDDLYKGFNVMDLKKLIALLAVVLILTISYITFSTYTNEAKVYATVSVDINPSLEMDISSRFTVNYIRSFNDEADDLALETLIGMPLDKALDRILDKAQDQGYLDKESPVLISSLVHDEKSEALVYNIQAVVDLQPYTDCVTFLNVKPKELEVETGEERTVSLGRQILMVKLVEVQNDIEEMTLAELVAEAEAVTEEIVTYSRTAEGKMMIEAEEVREKN